MKTTTTGAATTAAAIAASKVTLSHSTWATHMAAAGLWQAAGDLRKAAAHRACAASRLTTVINRSFFRR
jgi:hypothetical protein